MNFDKLENQRLEFYNKFKGKKIVGILLFILGICLLFFGFISIALINLEAIFRIMLIVLASIMTIIGIVFMAIASKIMANFNRYMKPAVIGEILSSNYENGTYNFEAGIAKNIIMETGLITRNPDRYFAEDYIYGEYKNIICQFSDVQMQERHVTTDSQGHVHTTYETFFKGRWFVFNLNKNTESKILIKKKKAFKEMNVKGLEKVELESIDFNEKFMTYASSEQKLFYYFTPYVVEKILEYEQTYKGKIMFGIIGDTIHIGFDSYYDYLEISIKKPFDEEALKKVIDEVVIAKKIIDDFKLYQEKFTSGGGQ